jgi:hypothetical protein
LDCLQHVARLLYPRPVDLLRGSAFAPCRRRAAIAAATLEMRAHTLRFVCFERAGVRLRIGNSDFLEHIQDGFALDFELSC